MFDPTSRYYALETATHVEGDGKNVSFKKRRFLPNGNTMPLLVEYKMKGGERLDLITSQTLGDPLQFWRICDANNANNPQELTEDIDKTIRIPIPQA